MAARVLMGLTEKSTSLTHFLLCRPWPLVTSLGLCSTLDVITLTKIGITSSQLLQEEKYISNDAQIRVISSMEPEIHVCTKNAQKFEWKTRSKISWHYTWLLHGKNCRINYAFSVVFELEASPVEGQSLQQKDNTRRKRKGKKKDYKNQKPKHISHFLVQKLKILISAHVVKRYARLERKACCHDVNAFFE